MDLFPAHDSRASLGQGTSGSDDTIPGLTPIFL
jgi:hypothetical protein